jgi:HlyD family secretion protein
VQQVSVGTQVSGVIEKLYVDFNSVVKKGDLLATLDMSVLNERLMQASATLTASQSALVLAQQTYDRTKALYDRKPRRKRIWKRRPTLCRRQRQMQTMQNRM